MDEMPVKWQKHTTLVDLPFSFSIHTAHDLVSNVHYIRYGEDAKVVDSQTHHNLTIDTKNEIKVLKK